MTYALRDISAFNRVLFNGLLIDSRAAKMSKTAGNVTDPDLIINEMGVDRFRLMIIRNITGSKFIRHQESPQVRKLLRKLQSIVNFMGDVRGIKLRIISGICDYVSA